MGWSDAFKIEDLRDFRSALEGRAGVYEFGFVRSGVWTPVYIGRAKCLWRRLRDYSKGRGHNHELNELMLYAERKRLYVHYIRTDSFREMEARMLHRNGVGQGNYYKYNKRKEPKPGQGGQIEIEVDDSTTLSQCAGYCRVACPRRDT
jgi:excinuclease UvrABC nuclease subunit